MRPKPKGLKYYKYLGGLAFFWKWSAGFFPLCVVLGLLGGKWGNDESAGHVTSRLALIGGTSTCHMVVRELVSRVGKLL